MIVIELQRYETEIIRVKDFPPFIRITLGRKLRKELFSRAMKKVGTIKRKYEGSDTLFENLYGKKKGRIVRSLLEAPQQAKDLIDTSDLSPSAVYHFLGKLRKQNIVRKEGNVYLVEENSFDQLSLSDIVKLEEDSALRRKYGISVSELELAYYLWERFLEVTPEDGGYARTYTSKYTLADAIHRWKTGRTDTPVWALERLIDLSESSIVYEKDSIERYHLPPGIPVLPYHDGEYKLPIVADTNLDKIVIQLLQKMSKNHLYTFPKKRRWLFEALHQKFGEFDDSTFRIPSAIIEILKSYYSIETLSRFSARIPSRMQRRWTNLNPLYQITEKSSILLHAVSLSSRSNGGFEITSRSKPLLQDISFLSSTLGLGSLTVRKKHSRPHFRAYLSENKVDVLRRYVRLFEIYPDLEIWMRIPLNQIAEKVVLTDGDTESIEQVCIEELSQFVHSILRSLERKKKGKFQYISDYIQHEKEITSYFWQKKLIPSPKKVEELLEMQIVQEESLLYVY
jgi:hypothetical protein